MTGGDARGEAERIVDGFVQAICDLSDGNALLPEAEENDRDRLVAALAAAIEVVEARMDKHSQKNRPIEEAMQRNIAAHEELERALSALRARAGEET